jgi:hypothetical protein
MRLCQSVASHTPQGGWHWVAAVQLYKRSRVEEGWMRWFRWEDLARG